MPKDFMLDEGITSPNELLCEKTKDLAGRFIAWRKKLNMSLLRGSGPVAFVSGWKSFVKNAIEAEKSNVMSIYDFTGSPLNSVKSLEDAEKQYFYNQHSQSGITTDADLKKVSLSQILKSSSAEFLSTIGMTTAYDLRSVDKSENSKTVKKMIEWRASNGYSPLLPASCVEKLYDWLHQLTTNPNPSKPQTNIHTLKNELNSSVVRFLSSVGIHTAKDLYNADKRERSKLVKAMIKWRAENGLPKIRQSFCVQLLYDWTHLVNIYKAKNEKMQSTGHYHHEKVQDLEVDPIKVLSKVSRDFLKCQGITNAAQFLSNKSSSLTQSYIQWRVEQGMPTLKGYRRGQ